MTFSLQLQLRDTLNVFRKICFCFIGFYRPTYSNFIGTTGTITVFRTNHNIGYHKKHSFDWHLCPNLCMKNIFWSRVLVNRNIGPRSRKVNKIILDTTKRIAYKWETPIACWQYGIAIFWTGCRLRTNNLSMKVHTNIYSK